ncbi:MAG: protein-methionine-sulfoxide reductase catalytic subunit MsrP [Bdellovibrio sp. CG10_big_fil_rev_8_21_14_0_10_47_8]|nr:MAG: protein-methionine-sulfoxide reductase catalytic subunit MsrP [Bdellovibrio sp. CG10_big_fil_rev_8_21_14_0_10_47_8]
MMKEQITPEFLFLHRRELIQKGFLLGMASVFPKWAFGATSFPAKKNEKYGLPDKDLVLTKEDVATSYNNFYEFSLEKGEVKTKVEKWNFNSKDWKIEISGLVEKKKSYSVEELCELAGGIEERIYRFRCVEAWSMVVPWTGFPLARLIEKLKPKSSAKFVKFQSFSDQKIGSNMSELPQYPWPYTEGLTLAEAMNPLTLIATGMYGKTLPKQNGAPLRLVTPWKYGFKSIKSIVKIEFTDVQPKTLWSSLAPAEYGFYANVNPQVDHPRWSQATERILDSSFFPKRKPTLMFNGYEKEVADLYKGLDLAKNY